MQEHTLLIQSPLPHSLTYYEWGNPLASKTVLCVHGLTRNARDFDFLAQALAGHYRVICVDMPGRGKSERLSDPLQYNYLTYLADMQFLISSLQITSFHWVGTSMGGIIGMMLANALPGAMSSLVLNDIGCLIPAAGLRRILSYAGVKMQFSGMDEAQRALRETMSSFGISEEQHWQHIFTHSLITQPDGTVRMAYDAAIMSSFPKPEEIVDVNLWGTWEGVTKIPTLLLRGEQSDILPLEVAGQMQQLHPALKLETIRATGHAPMLMTHDQIGMVSGWLGGANG